MTISQRLFNIMESRHISVPDLSRMTGISKPTIYDWKKKNTNPGADKIMVLCEALQITPEELLVGIPEEADISEEEHPTDIDGATYEMARQINSMSEIQRKRMLAYMTMLMNKKDR